MPRVKTIRNPTPTQTRRLVRQAILICGSKRGAPYRSIKKYVNANTTEPYVADVSIKNALRVGIHEGSYVQDGAFFKLKLKRLGFEPGPAPVGLSRKASTVPTVRHKAPTRTTGVKSLHGWQKMIMFLIGMFVFASLITAVKAESDEDDDLAGEIIIDLLTGVVLEMCTESVKCSQFLTIFTLAMLMFGLVMTCITGECFFECPTSRDIRRGATVYGGMRARRWYR